MPPAYSTPDAPDEEGTTIEGEALEDTEAEPRNLLPGASEASSPVERSRKLLENMHAEDREEAIDLHEKIGAVIESGDAAARSEAACALREQLFLMEGKPN